jgi:PPOX class probable F420-dependent enzyme
MAAFDVFAEGSYVSLETLKKSGQPVATPVWFAKVGEKIYVYSLADAWKVRRVRNNPNVRLAPCDIRGKLTSGWVSASARVVDGEAERDGHAALDRKYLMKRVGGLWARLLGRRHAIILITPVGA